MKDIDISNFKKFIMGTPHRTCENLDLEQESKDAHDILEEYREKRENLLQESLKERSISDSERKNAYPLEDVTTEATWAFLSSPTVPLYSSRIQFGVSEIEANDFRDELNQKNQIIKILSANLELNDKLFARLLNKLSVGFVIFFLVTVFVCYLAFS